MTVPIVGQVSPYFVSWTSMVPVVVLVSCHEVNGPGLTRLLK
jgi:hypothetical protein